MKKLFIFIIAFAHLIFSDNEPMHEHHEHHEHHDSMETMDHSHHSSQHNPAPIGVAGNMHHMGWMFAVKQGSMSMQGNILDGKSISNSEILLRPNEVSNMPINLSVIPKKMDMEMIMIEAMYAPSKDLTLMIMGTQLSKDMSLDTYSAMMNRDLIGSFSTSSSDFSDIKVSALFTLKSLENSKSHAEFSYQKSIGSNNEMDKVFTPMGSYMNMTLPYAMQPSDKASRLALGLTNSRKINDKTSLSGQIRYKKIINEKDWSFGNQTEINSWIQYQYKPNISLSTRLKFINQEEISGSSATITAPVQTANPTNYGGNELHLGFGANYKINLFANESEQLGIEILFPLMQNKNNLQMETDYQFIVGYKRTF